LSKLAAQSIQSRIGQEKREKASRFKTNNKTQDNLTRPSPSTHGTNAKALPTSCHGTHLRRSLFRTFIKAKTRQSGSLGNGNTNKEHQHQI
jgi:hypothetical protein